MRFVAFKGATAFEAQLGPYWIKVARPRFWAAAVRRPDLVKIVQVGVQKRS